MSTTEGPDEALFDWTQFPETGPDARIAEQLAESQRWRRRTAEALSDAHDTMAAQEDTLDRVRALHVEDEDGNCSGCFGYVPHTDCPTLAEIEADIEYVDEADLDDEEDED